MREPADLPPRLLTSEVLQLARISARTFRRRKREGRWLVQPIDRGAEDIYDRDAVLAALNIAQPPAPEPAQPASTWKKADAHAISEARSRQVRSRLPRADGRHAPGRVRGAEATAAVRLAVDNTAAD
ncbi:MAG TPA: hypothetical protein VGN74_05380 [Brevundimonas sp.]|jgi:hypothetical protein|uniref:hypothetical protein n=1 Tax=Brevundimonas sp. TaxID=1871086 RepID=UPI002E156E1C|nr:hypothetical protein [Brevundimonas sp.]